MIYTRIRRHPLNNREKVCRVVFEKWSWVKKCKEHKMEVEKTIWVQYTDTNGAVNTEKVYIHQEKDVSDLKKAILTDPTLSRLLPSTGSMTLYWPCGPLIGDTIDARITIQELFEEFDKYKEYNNRRNPIVIKVKENI